MKRQLALLSLAGILLVFGCVLKSPKADNSDALSAAGLTLPTTPLASGNAQQMIELARFESENTEPVVALAFAEGGEEILAVHTGENAVLSRWHLKNGDLLTVTNVAPAGMAAVSFDASARLLALGIERTGLASSSDSTSHILEWRLFNTHTGNFIFQTTANSSSSSTDVALSDNGRRLAVVHEGGFECWDTTSKEPIYLEIAGGITPTVITWEPSGEWVAYATREGYIGFKECQRPEVSIPGSKFVAAENNTDGKPLAMAVDPARRWLAVVMNNRLKVWNLQSGEGHLISEIAETSFADVVFSPNSDLLMIGTFTGWQIWGVSEWDKLLENTGQAAYAIAFSQDGRLLAWGDAQGVVHLWGVPSQ